MAHQVKALESEMVIQKLRNATHLNIKSPLTDI